MHHTAALLEECWEEEREKSRSTQLQAGTSRDGGGQEKPLQAIAVTIAQAVVISVKGRWCWQKGCSGIRESLQGNKRFAGK